MESAATWPELGSTGPPDGSGGGGKAVEEWYSTAPGGDGLGSRASAAAIAAGDNRMDVSAGSASA